MRYKLYENGNIICTTERDYKPPPLKDGNKSEKSYCINSEKYRLICSAGVNLWNIRRNKLTFFTFTFPFDICEVEANKCWSKMMDNLKKNYELKNYIATKERTERGRFHYHAIFDFPNKRYKNNIKHITRINAAWCKTFETLHGFVPNAVRLPDKRFFPAIVRDRSRLIRYICKYVSKSKGQYFTKPCYFVSRAIASAPQYIDKDFTNELMKQHEHKVFYYDYYTVISLDNVFIPTSQN